VSDAMKSGVAQNPDWDMSHPARANKKIHVFQ
jgi:hypothetical protein